MSEQVPDELLWSLDTLLKQDDRGARAGSDGDLARASVYAQGDGDAGKDLVFGHRPTQRRVVLSATSELGEDDDGLEDAISIEEVQPANWTQHAHMYSSAAAAGPSGLFQRSTSQQSLSEDGTDRSLSVASDDDASSYAGTSMYAAKGSMDGMPPMLPSIASSPSLLPSTSSLSSSASAATLPRSVRRMSEGDQIGYDERIEATLAGGAAKSLSVDEHERIAQMHARQFTVRDLAHFDPQFGRDVFLAQLGAGIIENDDSSSHRALTSLRMSMRQSSAAMAMGGDIGTVVRQGWIFKRGEVMPSWHKRWFTLRRMPHGPMLTYSKDKTENAPAKMIDLSSTTRCVITSKPSSNSTSSSSISTSTSSSWREHEFKLITSADAGGREFSLATMSSYELTEWVCALQSAVHAGNKSAVDSGGAASDLQRLWREIGLQGLIVRYGVRKSSSRNQLQTRVLELNFAEQTLTISRRGETLTSCHFSHIDGATVSSSSSTSHHGSAAASLASRVALKGKHGRHLIGGGSGSNGSNDMHGLLITFCNTGIGGGGSGGGKHANKPWPLFLDTREARDSLYSLLQKIVENSVTGADLEQRCSRFTLRTGRTVVKNAGPHATLKGKLVVCLHESSLVFYPLEAFVSDKSDKSHGGLSDSSRNSIDLADTAIDSAGRPSTSQAATSMTAEMAATVAAVTAATRPWYVLPLHGVHVNKQEEKKLLVVGRFALLFSSSRDCRSWFEAVSAVTCLPEEIVDIEQKERAKIRLAFQTSVTRLRMLQHARVTHEVGATNTDTSVPRDHRSMELMLRVLWSRVYPNDEFTSSADPRWLELGFQRGGPASDLRASGLLGLYCLTYFATRFPSPEFQRILTRTRHGVSTGNMKNYPFAIACINVALILMETLGLGNAGSHSESWSASARRTYALFVSQRATSRSTTSSATNRDLRGQSTLATAAPTMDKYATWDEIVQDADNHVFESMFCLLFPVLDSLFVEMGAGYMEFGQVVAAFRRRLGEIFDARPASLRALEELANEPVAAVLLMPTVPTKSGK